jgi:hypothetical protein
MKTTRKRRDTLVPLVIALVAASIALALVAGQARAADGGMSDMQGMSGMEGMSAEDMQNMATPEPTAAPTDVHAAASADGHGSGAAMDPNMDMGGGSANWLVVGGFVALIAGATLAAAATKRHLRRRMLAGELAGAGVQGV